MRAVTNTVLGQLVVLLIVATYGGLLLASRFWVWGWMGSPDWAWILAVFTPFALGIGIPYWFYGMHQLGQSFRGEPKHEPR